MERRRPISSHILDLLRAAQALLECLPKLPAPSDNPIIINAETIRAAVAGNKEPTQ